MKKISVIIPCYNAAPYLPGLMDSLMGQTIGLDSMEIICVNDASTDDTYERLLEYEKKCPDSIMIINLPENGRQGTARNIGMSYASGEYIGFVDADDYIEIDMYKLLYTKAREFDCDMAGGLVLHHENKREVVMPNHLKTDRLVDIIDKRGRMDILLNGSNGGICPKIYRRSMIYEQNLLFPEKTFFEDNYWLPVTCLYIKRYYIMNQVVYHYVDHPESTVNTQDTKAMDDRLEMEIQKLGAYAKRGFLKDYFLGIEALFCRSYYVDTLLGMYALWGKVPETYYQKMKQDVVSLFPRCMENFILIDKDKKLLQTAFEELSQTQLCDKILEYARER